MDVLDRIALRAHYLANQMIFKANHREDKEKGDPKIGGHSSASASSLHILGALHLVVKSGFDHIANKPHASPADHAYNYLLDLFFSSEGVRLSPSEADQAMMGLRAFSKNGEPVFQSYHSLYDPDHYNFFPSGTVGIPPVQAGYLACAYRFAKEHGYEVPPAHFWSVIGDSEFREGSLYEAMPDLAEREIGELTWIVDYNRQSLDGHRITNKEIMGGTDDVRLERTAAANGWQVIQVRHGTKRTALFEKKKRGELFKTLLEKELTDYELQALLLLKTGDELKSSLANSHKHIHEFLNEVQGEELREALCDFGGHDFKVMIEALRKSKESTRRPTLVIAHTLKGWGLQMAASPGNHSALPNADEMEALKKKQGISKLFERFDEKSPEGKFLKDRGEELFSQMKTQFSIREKNKSYFLKQWAEKEIPESLEINLKMASYPHTQWMLGQLTAKLTRLANAPDASGLSELERKWKGPAELLVSMAPDVGTSTNLNPAMDGKIFGSPIVEDFEDQYGVKDLKQPDLVPGMEVSDRFLRFEIAEGNSMSCMASFGQMRRLLGVPLMPLMTVYDFFIKRALDQYFYGLYWNSSFILVGTPSGVTLSPEGAQHGWKSDFQIPNQIVWEPFFCQELDWIVCESIRRHLNYDNEGRSGVLIRGVTRGADQKLFLHYLKKQHRFKVGLNKTDLLHPASYPMKSSRSEESVEAWPEERIMATVREEVLSGAYYLIDYRGYAGYDQGDNVVHILSMGSVTTEAIKASEELLSRGVYANVIVVTSPDLLVGNLGHQNDYQYLKQGLGLNGDLFISHDEKNGSMDFVTVAGRRVPLVSVHDGEPGLLDNVGSIIGVRQEALAVRKHSRSGRPSDIYGYHHLDAKSIVEAVGKVLSETALENIRVSPRTVASLSERPIATSDWRELWSSSPATRH